MVRLTGIGYTASEVRHNLRTKPVDNNGLTELKVLLMLMKNLCRMVQLS